MIEVPESTKSVLMRIALDRYYAFGSEDEILKKAVKCYVGLVILEVLKEKFPEYFTRTSTK